MLSTSIRFPSAEVLPSEFREDLHREATPGLQSHNTRSNFLYDSPHNQALTPRGPTRRCCITLIPKTWSRKSITSHG